MNFSKLFKAALRRLGIWWEEYYILQTDIDIDIINNKFSLLSEKIPHKITRLSYDDFLKGDKKFYTNKKLLKYKKWLIDNNREAYGIIIDNELAYSSWICFDKIELTNKTSLKNYENVALLQDAYCNSKFRGQGFHNYVNIFRLKTIYDRGIKTAIVIVRKTNLPALKVQKNSTLIITDSIILISLFGKEFIKNTKYDS